MGKVYVNDIGTKIRLDSKEDITAQTVLKIEYIKPSGATGSWDASVVDTTWAEYETVDGDLDERGLWTLRIYIELPDWKGHGEDYQQRIYDPDKRE